jgi:uroporphyrinogen decarboxylase
LPLSNADLISIDKVDLALVRRELSDKIRLVGNFDTSKIAFSSPHDIYKEVQTMVTCGKQSLKGYIVSTGCEVPIQTPRENVKAFIRAARESAWYWD